LEDDTVEYEEVVDFKKIGLIATILILGSIIIAVYVLGMDFPTIEIPEINSNEQIEPETETIQADPRIRDEYKKYIDFGLSEDDILNIQELPCEAFETKENFSQDPKYGMIFQQRESECSV